MTTIARELVTLLRYEIDERGLRKYLAMQSAVTAGAQHTAQGVRRIGDAADHTGSLMGRLGMLARTAIAGLGVTALARMSDEWAGVEGRVGLVTDGVQEQKDALKGLYELAQRTGQSYTGIAGVFQGIARNKTELGLTTDQAMKLSETIGTAMTIGGGSATSQQAALVQLSQALGTGTLRGEELNSIMEQAPRLAQAIAEAFGVPVGQLKKLGEQGKLTSKMLAAGLLKQSTKLRAEFEKMPKTFGRSMTMLSNALGQTVYRLNKATGAADKFARFTSVVVDNLDKILKYVAWLGAAAGLTKLAYVARGLAASGGLLASVLARFGGARAFGALLGTFVRMLAVATALYYVFDDIGVWLQGGDALLADIIGPMSDWKWLTDGIRDGLRWIQGMLGDTSTIEAFAAKWGLLTVIVGGIVAAIGLIPALITAAGLVIVWAIGLIRQNWDQAVREMTALWGSLVAGIVGAWDTILAKAQEVWGKIGELIATAVPEWARKGVAVVSNAVGGAVNGMGGGAAFGITPTMLPNRGGAGGSVVNNSMPITVNATSSQPAAVAEATRRGVERGMGSAMVPNVEVGR